MLRAILFLSGILSFFYFLKPQVFHSKLAVENTLGINTISAAANAEIVRQALTIHCINTQSLPSTLNELYENELSKEKYLDLDKIFSYSVEKDCDFELSLK